MIVVDQAQSGPAGAGWATVPVPQALWPTHRLESIIFVVEVEKMGSLVRKNGIGSMFILK